MITTLTNQDKNEQNCVLIGEIVALLLVKWTDQRMQLLAGGDNFEEMLKISCLDAETHFMLAL